ncbi:MAG: amino acid ABC transporter permease [Victivallales bacterium]|nr:amino acid ABC transporter permease [Victivallales bacterium]
MNYGRMLLQLLEGLSYSISIFCWTLFFSLPLGLLVALCRMSKFTVLKQLARFCISVLRGTPLMLQLFLVFYGPYYIFKMPLTDTYRFLAVIIGFSVNYAAYFAEIYRAGIEAIPLGQYEAAQVLGYSRTQTFFKIIVPQVVKRILPPVTNEVITLVKDTSLAFTLTIPEMFSVARQWSSARTTMIPLIAAGVFYYVFNFLVAMLMERFEKYLNYYR